MSNEEMLLNARKPSTTMDGIEGEASYRKLFFFWLIDNSCSMSDKKIQKVNWAIRDVLPTIRAIENTERVRIFMSAISFGDKAEWHIGPDPVHVEDFTWKELNGDDGLTSTARAIEILAEALDMEKLGTRNVPPVCILMSDGYNTDGKDNYISAIEKLNNIPWGKKAVRLSIGIGEHEADYDKEALNAFISPYLRKERNIETLHANSPQQLVQYIKIASTVASVASSKASSRIEDQNNIVPVDINKDDLNDDSAPDAQEDIDPNDVF